MKPRDVDGEIERFREVIAEARGTIKDLKALIKEAKEVKPELETALDERIGEIVVPKIKQMGEEVEKAMRASVEKVARTFDKLERAYTQGVVGAPSLEELGTAMRVQEWRKRQQ
jgi:regulator of replication initiation timing